MTPRSFSLRYRIARYVLAKKAARVARAWRYATKRLTPEDGFELLYEAQEVAGCWALSSFDVEAVVKQAMDTWKPLPQPVFQRLAREAASRVAHKWGGDDGESRGVAVDWAIELMRDYAERDGIELVGVDEGWEDADEKEADEEEVT